MREVTYEMKIKNVLPLKWKLILLVQLKLTGMSHQSIAGVTYRDNFDFEERYRNVYECDPFHWHPLHLPEHCAKMYEDLIQSRIAKYRPVRVFREREKPDPVIYSLNPSFPYVFQASFPTYVYSPPEIIEEERYEYVKPRLSPYEKMLELVRKDVEINPSAPTIGMTNMGPVAVYHQPISKKSENMIKKISGAYAKAGRKNHGGKYYGKIVIPGSLDEETEREKLEKNKDHNKIDTLGKVVKIKA